MKEKELVVFDDFQRGNKKGSMRISSHRYTGHMVISN
jgi:hypothetical protein